MLGGNVSYVSLDASDREASRRRRVRWRERGLEVQELPARKSSRHSVTSDQPASVR
jgi:hypothetical protein